MKARIAGTVYEVEVVPYFPEGMFAGFTDVSGSLKPGMVVYKPSDLEFLETPPKLKPETDWEAFRREAAKDILHSLITEASKIYEFESLNKGIWCEQAVEWADELIKQLKEEKI